MTTIAVRTHKPTWFDYTVTEAGLLQVREWVNGVYVNHGFYNHNENVYLDWQGGAFDRGCVEEHIALGRLRRGVAGFDVKAHTCHHCEELTPDPLDTIDVEARVEAMTGTSELMDRVVASLGKQVIGHCCIEQYIEGEAETMQGEADHGRELHAAIRKELDHE